mmetsp:Transcript_6435/g.19527  ORF Transcript_6435/g.19527 Transcript_6435/m.19527 type:complete len:253 (-) Transcript_6435:173-931(-)
MRRIAEPDGRAHHITMRCYARPVGVDEERALREYMATAYRDVTARDLLLIADQRGAAATARFTGTSCLCVAPQFVIIPHLLRGKARSRSCAGSASSCSGAHFNPAASGDGTAVTPTRRRHWQLKVNAAARMRGRRHTRLEGAVCSGVVREMVRTSAVVARRSAPPTDERQSLRCAHQAGSCDRRCDLGSPKLRMGRPPGANARLSHRGVGELTRAPPGPRRRWPCASRAFRTDRDPERQDRRRSGGRARDAR